MMKKLIFFAFCALALVSCAKEIEQPLDEPVPPGFERRVYSAMTETTRTSLGNSGSTLWSEGDKIKVWYSDDSSADFTLTSGANTSTGVFSGLAPSGKTAFYAVYPASAASENVSATVVNVTVPAAQAGAFSATNLAVSGIGSGNNLSFKNIAAVMRIGLPGGDVTKVVVESVDGSALAGDIPVDCASDPDPGEAMNTTSSITMETSGSGERFIAILPGVIHANGWKFTYYKGDTVSGIYYLEKSITTAANVIYSFGEFEPDGNYYVTVSGAGNGNGLSWANAMSAAQMWARLDVSTQTDEARAAKIAAIDGATFHMAAGDYDFGESPTVSINETEAVSLTFKGGYNASTGARNVAGNATNITGGNSHGCLRLSGKMNITLDGLRFLSGKVSGDPDGALYCSGKASVTMIDCIVSNNSGTGSNGAGVALNSAGKFEATRVTFAGNEGKVAPALLCISTNITLDDCVFQENHCTSWCGAVRVRKNSPTAIFSNCRFYRNSSPNDSGCFVHSEGNVTFENCEFTENTCGGNGGAFTTTGAVTTTFNGTSFTGNVAGKGGAIYAAKASNISINGSTFEGNHTTAEVNVSGGENGGALYVTGAPAVKIRSSQFNDNYAGTGGAIYTIKDSSGNPCVFINACSFSGNYVQYRYGAAINIDNASYFCINNSSFANDHYLNYSSGTDGLKPSWVALDGIENCSVISNCSLIGRTWRKNGEELLSALTNNALIGLWEAKKTYLINDLIILDTNGSSFSPVRGNNEEPLQQVVAYYTHYSKDNINVDWSGDHCVKGYWREHTRYGSGEDDATWDENCWKWNGYYVKSGNTIDNYDKITKSDFMGYLNEACPDFATWLGADIYKDQLGNERGINGWWPGAYQAQQGDEAALLQAITWNIRSSDMGDTGDHAWSARRDGMAAFINDRKPHIICMQECEKDQREYLVDHCQGYDDVFDNTSLSWWEQNVQGLEKSNQVILYNSEDISVQSSGTFWLVSGAPTSPSKSSDQNSFRSCCWMKCTYKGQKMLVMDVHLSYRTKNNSHPGSDESIALRQQEMAVIKTWIDGHYNPSSDGWLLFMGDMNTSHWEAIFDEWKDGTYGYFSRAGFSGGALGRTYNDWDWENGHVATIDYQFYKGFPSVKSYTIPTDTYSDVDYLSDHWPVVVEYRMN